MKQEIERKFLLNDLPPGFERAAGVEIDQGYLAAESRGRQVRLRRKGGAFYITVKSAPNGFVRDELEVELSREQFEALWPMTAGWRLRKTRYDVPWEEFTVEIDLYAGLNEGLRVAEVEFDSDEQARAFQPPPWMGRDVSADPALSNRNLARE